MKNNNLKPKKILGVIPARGGSKGIPDKNIVLIHGRPLISYTIHSALKSQFLTKCIVSTDSEKIAGVARDCGMEVPFLRPQDLAQDLSLSVDVIKHAIVEMERLDHTVYEFVVMLQPTTPLKSVDDIDGTTRKLIETGCDTVVSMVDVGANHPARMYTIDNDRLVSVMPEGVAMKPRQLLPPVYIRSGAVYACRRDVIFKYNALIGPDCRPYIMPEERSVNIDSKKDLYLVDYYLSQQTNEL